MLLKQFKVNRKPRIEDDWKEFIKEASIRAVKAAKDIREGLFPLPAEKCGRFCEFYSLCRGGRFNAEKEYDAG